MGVWALAAIVALWSAMDLLRDASRAVRPYGEGCFVSPRDSELQYLSFLGHRAVEVGSVGEHPGERLMGADEAGEGELIVGIGGEDLLPEPQGRPIRAQGTLDIVLVAEGATRSRHG